MKEQILSGTASYLLNKGIAGLSLRPLAKAIGTSDRMILYYFGTKNRLLTSAVEQIADQVIDAIEQQIRQGAVDSPGQFMQTVWDVFCQPTNRKAAYLFYEIEVASFRQPRLYRKVARRLLQKWRALIRSGLARGEGAAIDEARADRIGAELVGLFLQFLIAGDEETQKALAALVRQG